MLTKENEIKLNKLHKEIFIKLLIEKTFRYDILGLIIIASFFYLLIGWISFIVCLVLIYFEITDTESITNTERNYLKQFKENGFVEADISVKADDGKVNTIQVWLDKTIPRMYVYIPRYVFR
jgi:hypothetical protein